MQESKINTIEHDMQKVKTDMSYIRKDITSLNKKLDGLCKKIDENYVRKDIYDVECESIKQDIGFVKGVIFSIAGIIGVTVLGGILNLVLR